MNKRYNISFLKVPTAIRESVYAYILDALEKNGFGVGSMRTLVKQLLEQKHFCIVIGVYDSSNVVYWNASIYLESGKSFEILDALADMEAITNLKTSKPIEISPGREAVLVEGGVQMLGVFFSKAKIAEIYKAVNES